VGIKPAKSGYVLLFGERRLRAVQLLRWDKIACHVIDVDGLAQGSMAEIENDENATVKPFTVSEKVAIAKAVDEAIGKRQGRRTDRELRENSSEVGEAPDKGQRTEEFVAAKAGFGSRWTMRKAEKAVDQGVPELVEAMDQGKIAVDVAAAAAELPAKTQQKVVELVRGGEKPKAALEKVGGIKKPKKKKAQEPPLPSRVKDKGGKVIPDNLRDVMGDPSLPEAIRWLDEVGVNLILNGDRHRRILEKKRPFLGYLNLADFIVALREAQESVRQCERILKAGQADYVCRGCEGTGCKLCRPGDEFSGGHMPAWRHEELKKAGEI
jgi:ParB-like chromosome segregation protein Spo0J